MAAHRAESREDMAAFRVQIHDDMAAYRAEMHEEMAAHRAETREDLNAFRAESREYMDALAARFDEGFREVRTDLRTWVTVSIGLSAAVAVATIGGIVTIALVG